MAWLACSSGCSESSHWITNEDFKTPLYTYYQSSGVWYYKVKNIRHETKEHRGLTWAAACTMADAMTSYEPRGGIGLDGAVYRSAKVSHCGGEEYAVVVTTNTHEPWEGPYQSQSAQ